MKIPKKLFSKSFFGGVWGETPKQIKMNTLVTKKMLHSNLAVGENGHLRFAGVDTVAMVQKYGSPLMLLDEGRVRERCREYKAAMRTHFGGDSMPLFASKALSFKEIYRIMASEKVATDIVSPGELYTAAAAGFPMERAFFHGNNKTDGDIRFGMEKGIGYFVVDGREELLHLNAIAGEFGRKQKKPNLSKKNWNIPL